MKAWRQVAILAVLIGPCSCGHPPLAPTPATVVQTVVVRRGCLHDAAKPQPSTDFAAVVGDSCKPWGACYPLKDAIALSWYIAAMERWIDDAIIDCGSTSATDAGAPLPATDAGNGAP